MKRNKKSILLLATIMLLIIVLHHKLHSKKRDGEVNETTAIQTSSRFANDLALFPSIFYRLAEIRRY